MLLGGPGALLLGELHQIFHFRQKFSVSEHRRLAVIQRPRGAYYGAIGGFWRGLSGTRAGPGYLFRPVKLIDAGGSRVWVCSFITRRLGVVTAALGRTDPVFKRFIKLAPHCLPPGAVDPDGRIAPIPSNISAHGTQSDLSSCTGASIEEFICVESYLPQPRVRWPIDDSEASEGGISRSMWITTYIRDYHRFLGGLTNPIRRCDLIPEELLSLAAAT